MLVNSMSINLGPFGFLEGLAVSFKVVIDGEGDEVVGSLGVNLFA